MKHLIATFALALLVTPAAAEVHQVRLATDRGTIVGTLNLGAFGPVVLMLHGFTGTRDELPVEGTDQGVFERTALALGEAGLSTLRIDFIGSGDSEGAWADTTFSGQVADAMAALDWLADDDRFDSARIGILGWSQGGLVAAETASRRPDVAALSLWAPVAQPRATFGTLFGHDIVDAALATSPEDTITAALPWGVETTLNAGFFHEMVTTSPAAALGNYAGPVQVLVGARDTLVSPQPASGALLLRYHTGPSELTLFDTDHVWDAFSGPDTLDTKMIPATLAWFQAHL